MNNSLPQIFAGVDVSKKTLEVHMYPLKKGFTVSNSIEGIQEIRKKFLPYSVSQIVCEATGGYENLLVTEFKGNIWVVEPKRIKAFIVSENIKAKTDKIDAAMIALFAAQKNPKHKPVVLTTDESHIKALSRRRSDVIEMITKESNRLQHPTQIYCKPHIKKHISFLQKELAMLNSDIEQLIKNNADLAKKNAIVRSVPGIGPVTASVLICSLPELGNIGDKQLAALVGVAPFDKQSGNYKGNSIIRDGRAYVRKSLYMAALVASRFNPVMKAFYERLCASGKNSKKALVAIMRKLLIILNTMIKKQATWAPASI